MLLSFQPPRQWRKQGIKTGGAIRLSHRQVLANSQCREEKLAEGYGVLSRELNRRTFQSSFSPIPLISHPKKYPKKGCQKKIGGTKNQPCEGLNLKLGNKDGSKIWLEPRRRTFGAAAL
jgi:hypothetical protein